MTAKQTWTVKNISRRIISIGDLPKVPSFDPGSTHDLLRYYDKETINRSNNLSSLMRAKLVKLIKKTNGTREETSDPAAVNSVEATDTINISNVYNKSETTSIISNTPRNATLVVAAVDSLNKDRADYICDGVDDDVQIQAAHDAFSSTVGGKIVLMEGSYSLSSTIVFNRYICLEGAGSSCTKLERADNCDTSCMILLDEPGKNVPLSRFQHFKLEGNWSNQTNAGTPDLQNLHGIQQEASTIVGQSWVDIQFEDIWFNGHSGACIYLTQGWDHRIHYCCLENGPGIGLYIGENTAGVNEGVTNVWFESNYIQNLAQGISGSWIMTDRGTIETDGTTTPHIEN